MSAPLFLLNSPYSAGAGRLGRYLSTLLSTRLSRSRRYVSEAAHLALSAAALVASVWLRFEFHPDPAYRTMLLALIPLALLAKWAVFRAFSLRDLAWKYMSFDDLVRLGSANFTGSLCVAALGYLRWHGSFPRSVYVLDFLLSLALMSLARAGARLWHERRGFSPRTSAGRGPKDLVVDPNSLSSSLTGPLPRRRILIYGAGKAGRAVLSDIRGQREWAVEVVGFLDDDPAKRYLRLSGLRVVGGRESLAQAVKQFAVHEVWLALPRASGSEIAGILEQCHRTRVSTKRIPPLAELIEKKGLLDQVREVRIEDLLGRPAVTLNPDGALESRATSANNRVPRFSARPVSAHSAVDNASSQTSSVVLVTGAGGSIGSELCRQIARTRPRAVIGFDHSEAALYQIDQEIRQLFPGVAFYPEIGNIQNAQRLREVFAGYRPDTVYHAAAYKHVPLMESQVFEALENNVFGTEQLVRAARAGMVRRFVLISSDKAVAPTNVMGATKRLAEAVCLHAGPKPDSRPADPFVESTRLLAVRFGNVLGSSGSVIPLFKRQIAAGGPVTITHPEMRRYFMTIPEAVELVLQAASLGTGGEIFVLDMGEPVKILDLARKMILLSGLRPEQDIAISFTGVRPGEKLFEELHTSEEETQATPHPKIRVYRQRANCVDGGRAVEFSAHLEALRRCVAVRDLASTIMLLTEMIPDYRPSTPILRRAVNAATSPGRPDHLEPRRESRQRRAANA